MRKLAQMSEQQAEKARFFNNVIEALQSAGGFGVRYSGDDATAGLKLGLYGATLVQDGTVIEIDDTFINLTDSVFNYIEMDHDGSITKTGNGSFDLTTFNAERLPLYVVECNAIGIVEILDYRQTTKRTWGVLNKDIVALAGADWELSAFEAMADEIVVTGTLVQNETISLPSTMPRKIVFTNNTQGDFTLHAKLGSIQVQLLRNDSTEVISTGSDLKSISGVQMGNSISAASKMGKAYVNNTVVGNVTTGEDDLQSYTLPANALRDDWNATGKGVRITAWGTTANNGNTKTLRFRAGGTAILTKALTASQLSPWKLVIEINSYAAVGDQQTYCATLMQGGTTNYVYMEQGDLSLDDASAIILKVTGDATATNDITNRTMLVEFMN